MPNSNKDKLQKRELYEGLVTIKYDKENHKYWFEDPKTKKLERLCGVTTYIGIKDKPCLIPWSVNTTVDFIRDHLELLTSGTMSGDAILRQAKQEANRQKSDAAKVGSQIHEWCDDYIKYKLKQKKKMPEMPRDDRAMMGATSFLNWVEQHKVKFLWSEKIVYSKKFEYVGTADLGVEIKGKRYLVDLKTGNGIYSEVKLQTAAYLMAEMEETYQPYSGRWVLRIAKETEDEYRQRMEQKGKTNYPPYKIFEAVFLDDDEATLEKDFIGFISARNLYTWDKYATKDFNKLKKKIYDEEQLQPARGI